MDGLIGLVSNVFSTILTHPIDVVKTNYQLVENSKNSKNSKNKNQSMNSIIKEIKNTRGVRGFYIGLLPNLSAYPIFWCTFFASNQIMNRYVSEKIVSNEYGDKFIKSYAAGLIGSSLTNPIFVIKTRMQDSNNEGV